MIHGFDSPPGPLPKNDSDHSIQWMRRYRFSARRTFKLVTLEWINGLDIWTLVKLRTPKRCAITGKPLAAGQHAYSPITNGDNRMDRISEDGMKLLENPASTTIPKEKS